MHREPQGDLKPRIPRDAGPFAPPASRIGCGDLEARDCPSPVAPQAQYARSQWPAGCLAIDLLPICSRSMRFTEATAAMDCRRP